MEQAEYLVSFGVTGEFGRFRAAAPLLLRRGSRVVIRSQRGLELGQVLRPATDRHARFLHESVAGELHRPASPDDEEQAQRMKERALRLLARAADLAEEESIPVVVLDAEVLLDGRHGVLHVVRWGEYDLREWVRPLSVEFELSLHLEEMGAPAAAHGCGDCGSGGCGSCGSGGCGTGCGVARPEEVSAYFAELREKMERRVSLL
jgi:hypothetical protein